jgi:hypothetical protein
MDPKKIAEEIVKDLFNTYDLVEEKEEEKDEEEGEEEEAGEEEEGEEEEEAGEEEGEEDSEEDKAPVAKAVGNAMKGSATTSAAASISLKGQLPQPAKSSGVVHDALGGGVKDAHGGEEQMIQPTATNAGANAATLNMKPSFITQAPKMTAEEVNTDISAIFGSQEISEQFAKNAASIYEAAVAAKVESITEALVEQFEEKLVEEVETVKSALVEQLDNYLAYVVQEWAKENAVAIENGLRTEIAEDFIKGLKNLFAESYVEVPEDKVDLFEELSEAVETLEGRINEEIEKNVELTKEISLLTAQRVFAEETRGLSVLQAEKAREIAENLEYSGEEDFRNKVKNLVEGVSASNKKTLKPNVAKVNEQVTLLEKVSDEPSEEQEETLSPLMELYSKTINRTLNS